jgi:hypothetical protein
MKKKYCNEKASNWFFLTTFFLNIICFNLAAFYDNLSFLTIITSFTYLLASLLTKDKLFLGALFLFILALPIYLICQFFGYSLLFPLLFTLTISLPFYGKDIVRFIKIGDIRTTKTWIAILLLSIISAIALIIWGLWSNNIGLGKVTIEIYKSYNVLIIFLIGPTVVIFNAVAEEIIFRGIIQTELNNIFNKYLSNIFQASLFASAHVGGGFPNGKIGYAMTFTYAILLGCMRNRTKGLLAPIITHIVADSTIFIFLYCMY